MVATRKCIDCGFTKSKSDYSKAQWSKKRDGCFASKCKNCVASPHDAATAPTHESDSITPSGSDIGDSSSNANDINEALGRFAIANANTTNSAISNNSNRYAIATQKAQKEYEDQVKRKCVGCGDTGDPASGTKSKKRCTACKAVYYCGRTCQINHRPDHKLFCNFIKDQRVGGDNEDSLPYFCHECQELFTTLSQLTYHKKNRINCNLDINGEKDDSSDVSDDDFSLPGSAKEDILNEILADIDVIETLHLKDHDDATFFDATTRRSTTNVDLMENLEWHKKHWNLCYCREEQLEEIRQGIVYADWKKKDYIAPRNVDGDNEECVLCDAGMELDGDGTCYDGEAYRANRLACCGARYCHKKQHRESLPASCPSCRSPLLTSENASKDNLLRHAEHGKTWAQLELAERYNKVHPSVADSAADGNDYEDRRNYYENIAIRWARKASDCGNVLASIFLAQICHNGGIRTSEHSWSTFYEMSERTMLMKRAADTGDISSIAKYADRASYFTTKEETLRYWTLCAHQSNDNKDLGRAYNILGEDCENTGGGEERQLYLFEQGALNGNAAAMAGLVYVINNICTSRFGSCSFTKYSQLPKMYYWAQKSAEAGCREGLAVLDEVERQHIINEKCACLDIGLCVNKNKRRGTRGNKGLIPCERCGTVFFCSNTCRVAYDEIVGHTEDCCSCSYCKINGPYMGFANWRRPCGSGGSVPMTWE